MTMNPNTALKRHTGNIALWDAGLSANRYKPSTDHVHSSVGSHLVGRIMTHTPDAIARAFFIFILSAEAMFSFCSKHRLPTFGKASCFFVLAL